ncbi:isoleucyl-tRNA synthetase [Roseimicrobium gellanilyticum]|uniref:Isoleucine--tRNA ligase n=1 Tax=Roseimicrobium gellanilyticum TaxID=748857 RepID=A0A366HN93_9BACT|nr:isoleucine--tRNA ligase [Roseimicrobium gellanilyticum]RBP44652.1 isoleucyl-tRNA synthetase [Roseimicrobium gellanilyticum]
MSDKKPEKAKNKEKEAPNPYKDSLHLPVTEFPMRASLTEREPQRLAQWEAANVYERIQERRKGNKKFVLHDGPPFANGDVHMGTALNKVLKDLVVKSKSMLGYYAPFVPGWDCHGLPIEFRVVKESAGLSPVEIRRKSEEYARKYIDIQRESFKRLGVFGTWEKPYLTLDPAYEADIIRTFAKFVEQDLIYRSKRPVIWSYGAGTALAEAEVEYKDKTSPAIYVAFNLVDSPSLPAELKGASMVIWTTTPWTLPANLGIALHAEFGYIVGDFANAAGETRKLVVYKDLLGEFTAKTGFTLAKEHATLKGSAFAGLQAQHPFLDRTSKVINTDFVTADTGTGQVHIAPGHGQDDYLAGKAHGMEIFSPVDDKGHYTSEVGLPDLVGKHVFQSNEPIITLLGEKGALLARENYVHQYPHCWRSKTPIIFRAVEQFFIKIDKIRGKALEEIDKVQWLPAWARNRIFGTVESRPDWCISRQRTWGVPLPAFYAKDGSVILTADLACKVADIFEKEGTNAWFEKDDATWAQMLGLPEGTSRGVDTLDVWIDSGCSHVAVLDRHPELGAPADLYLEATDQHRGWFQSSLMVSVVARGTAPYKSVITHGFVVDTSGAKISKSDQGTNKNAKPMTASHYYNKYGGDLVRLWAASVDYQNEVPFSEQLFEQSTQNYRSIRNTLRVLLGNLNGFDANKDAVSKEQFTLLDGWILERLHRVTKECREAYDAFEFRKVFNALNQFCTVDLSSLYIDITKDRLYCDRLDSPRRRATQTAMHRITESLCLLLAPILAFTADETWEYLGKTESVHVEEFPQPDPDFAGEEASAAVEDLLKVRAVIQQSIEKARQEKRIGANLEATVNVTLPEEGFANAVFQDSATMEEFFILSTLKLTREPKAELFAEVLNSPHQKCARCWKYLPSVGTQSHADLCDRCEGAV